MPADAHAYAQTCTLPPLQSFTHIGIHLVRLDACVSVSEACLPPHKEIHMHTCACRYHDIETQWICVFVQVRAPHMCEILLNLSFGSQQHAVKGTHQVRSPEVILPNLDAQL